MNPLPATREEIAALIPHQGAMCLLEAVIAASADHILCRTRTHVSPAHPLAREGRLAGVHLCEYGAQALAVHGGLLARQAGRGASPGLLVALREVVLHVGDVPRTGRLDVEARRLAGGATGSQYEFTVRLDGQLLASGRATVMTEVGSG